MDPVSQGVFGSLFAQSCAKKENLRAASFVGCVAGMFADLDIFIRSSADPLLSIEYHRHFTHSLFFIPFGALLVSGLLYPVFRKYLGFRQLYGFSLLGYGSHGFLDACTSYGTQLWVPFSNYRVAWDVIAVIDPLFTLPLLLLCVLAFIKRRANWSRYALIFAAFYLILGVVQRERAHQAILELAESRGHTSISRLTVKPSIFNIIVWRSIYQVEDTFYVDAVRVGMRTHIIPGAHIERFPLKETLQKFPTQFPTNSTLRKDLLRFAHFSNDYLVKHPRDPDVIADIRYAVLPNSIYPLWGVHPYWNEPERHVRFINFHEVTPETWTEFGDMLFLVPSLPAPDS